MQTLVRWEGIASARIYGRAAAEAYSDDIAEAMAVDAGGVSRDQLPEIDPIAALRDIDAALEQGAAEASDKSKVRAAEAVQHFADGWRWGAKRTNSACPFFHDG